MIEAWPEGSLNSSWVRAMLDSGAQGQTLFLGDAGWWHCRMRIVVAKNTLNTFAI